MTTNNRNRRNPAVPANHGSSDPALVSLREWCEQNGFPMPTSPDGQAALLVVMRSARTSAVKPPAPDKTDLVIEVRQSEATDNWYITAGLGKGRGVYVPLSVLKGVVAQYQTIRQAVVAAGGTDPDTAEVSQAVWLREGKTFRAL